MAFKGGYWVSMERMCAGKEVSAGVGLSSAIGVRNNDVLLIHAVNFVLELSSTESRA